MRDDRNHNDNYVVREVREEKRGGWGWLATLLTLAALALILWATGILDVNTDGSANDESLRGGADVQLNEPSIDFDVPANDSTDGDLNSGDANTDTAQ